MLELAGIAAVVLVDTLFGALISFDGSLSSLYARIVVGALLFVFRPLQRFFTFRAPRH